MKKFIFYFLVFNTVCLYSQTWTSIESGLNNSVYDMVEYNGSLAVCGNFTLAGGLETNGFAIWNGSSWTTSDTEIVCGIDMVVFHDTLFLCDQYGIHFWNGSELELYVNLSFNSGSELIEFNDNLYCLQNYFNLYRIDSGNLELIYEIENGVGDINVYQDKLYIGGCFINIGGVSSPHLAYFDGISFHAVESGLYYSSSVNCLATFDGELYAGGYIYSSSGDPGNFLIKWDGTSFYGLTNEPDNDVIWLGSASDMLFCYGDFNSFGSTVTGHFALWDGYEWSNAGAINNSISSIAEINGKVFIGGSFTEIDGSPVDYIAVYNTEVGVPNPLMDNEIVISPNPCSSYTTLKTPAEFSSKIFTVEIYNSIGKPVKTFRNVSSANYSIDVSDLDNGCYYYRVSSDNNWVFKGKLIVAR